MNNFFNKRDKLWTVCVCAKSLTSILATAFKIISCDKASDFKNTHPINKYLSKLVGKELDILCHHICVSFPLFHLSNVLPGTESDFSSSVPAPVTTLE